MCSNISFIPSLLTTAQVGLDVKTKPTEELTETVEIVEEVDEDQAIQEEVRLYYFGGFIMK